MIDEELEEEGRLLADLGELVKEIRIVRSNEIAADVVNLLTAFEAMIRAFKRKRAEAKEFRDHLAWLRNYLTECWDEEEEVFDPSYAESYGRVMGHWCPSLIQELDELLQPDTVWAPR